MAVIGYGEFNRSSWPYWQVAALSTQSPLMNVSRTPFLDCGACIELQCESVSLSQYHAANMNYFDFTLHAEVYCLPICRMVARLQIHRL
jgi:hypothetical protein